MINKIDDPHQFFSGWAFDIRKELWPTLGMVRREYVDRAKTKVAREAARLSGTPKDRLSHVKYTYYSYAIDSNPLFDFHEGDIFHAKHSGKSLQVSKQRDSLIEVWVLDGGRYHHASRVREHELSSWLLTGVEPAESRISRNESWSELAKFYILPPDTL